MPGFDGTGPRGFGPMTGGGRGYCAMRTGNARAGFRRGLLYEYTPLVKASESEMLTEKLDQLLSRLENIEAKIAQLEKR